MEIIVIYLSAIIMGLVLIYFAVRGIIYLNNYGFNEIYPSKKPARRISIYLSTLFILALFLIMNELINSFLNPEEIHLGIHLVIIGLYTLAFVGTAYILNKLLFINTLYRICIPKSPCFQLNKKRNPDARKDFEKICRFFKNEFNLFEESTDQLMDLINPDSESPIFFNIKKDGKEDQANGLTNRTLFFLFFRMLKEKCINTPNSSIVLLTRFRQDGKSLVESEKSLKNPRHSLSSEINRAISSIPEKELRPILHRMKEYQIQFSKIGKTHYRK